MIEKDLLDILVCPSCKLPVREEPPAAGENVQVWLTCTGCGLRYPVREDIPIMLMEEASPPKRPGA